MSRVERRLAAILVADVVGYSRLMGRDEEGTLRRVKQLMTELLRPKIKEHRGRVMKTTGDGLLAEFTSVVEAFHCAVEVQDTLEEQNVGLAREDRLDIRIGLNVGDIIFDDDDVFGDGVNIAARLEPLAEPGGICVSSRAWEDLRKLHLDFKDIGEQHLKNIDQPIRAYTLSRAQRRTVFSPQRIVPPDSGTIAPNPWGTQAPPPATGDPTVRRPDHGPQAASQPPAAAPTIVRPQPTPVERTSAPGGHVIQIGDVLNHIFEVTRFIARGGMGEVYEGKNVNSDERVAIKVILPALASDERVIAMFQREARTLTRLHHPALVQYRVLAREPRLGVLYIVTEYIDGTNLSDMLRTRRPTADELAGLLRRLARGLGAAHALGAIHRDMSPDNVLLPDGKLSEAKIIDFGIAKDLDTSQATIVGDGFAGKLSYVAPEQLGDFGRNVGPWTDVYSLALMIIAVATGEQVRMGGTLVEAVDRRRAEIDISAVPDKLKPVLAAMLRPNPKDRLQSMDEVLDRLDGAVASARTGLEPAAPASSRTRPLLLAGVAVVVLLLLGLAVALLRPSSPDEQAAAPSAGKASGAPAIDPVEIARDTINSAVPSISCSWLDIVDVQNSGGRIGVRMTGAAGDPSRAQGQISRALEAAGMNSSDINFAEVVAIMPGGCSALDAFRQIRNSEGARLSVPQREWKMTMQDSGDYAGRLAATAVVNMRIGDPGTDFALIGMEESGAFGELINSRAHLEELLPRIPDRIVPTGQDSYRVTMQLDHASWSGLVLFTGRGPFPPELIRPDIGGRGPEWVSRFLRTASDQGWKADMIWFKSVR